MKGELMIMMRKIRKFLGEKGQGIVEYALILAFVVAVAAVLTNGGKLREAVTKVFDSVTTQLNGSGGSSGNNNTQGN